jgi:TPP-dependent pyruvate/acetoin dehydrogenase alpha subunit
VIREVDEAVEFTNASPYPDPSVAFDDLYTDSIYVTRKFNDSTYGTLEAAR